MKLVQIDFKVIETPKKEVRNEEKTAAFWIKSLSGVIGFFFDNLKIPKNDLSRFYWLWITIIVWKYQLSTSIDIKISIKWKYTGKNTQYVCVLAVASSTVENTRKRCKQNSCIVPRKKTCSTVIYCYSAFLSRIELHRIMDQKFYHSIQRTKSDLR